MMVMDVCFSPPGAQNAAHTLVSRGQTLFCTEGKCLGHGHRAVCCPTPWSAYQSQHRIQSRYLKYVINGKNQISV